MSRIIRLILALVVSAFCVAVILVRNHSQPNTVTTTTTVVSGASGSTTVTDTSHSATAQVTVSGPPDEVKLFDMLPKPPAGAHKWAGTGTEGILTMEQYIEGVYSPSAWADERQDLPHRGFQYAVRVDWCVSDESSCVDVFFGHFATSTDAQSYYLAQTSADVAIYDAHGTYSVPGVPENKVFVKAELDSVGDAKLNAYAHDGSDVVHLVTETPANPDEATLNALMTSAVKNLDALQG
ncbi:hypothetical protein [Streptacidiphilus sp. MAP5-3]|uniref:hypothetical protein n=1 Tax=unclassified Streptacidiphilus TaxID=2643834 RepID=UPI00351329E9